MNEAAMMALADTFFSAIEKSDLAAVEQIYAPDAVVWHSYDNIAQSRADNIGVLKSFPAMFATFKYCDIRRHSLEGGFIQQHVLRGTTHAGDPFALFACMLITGAQWADQPHR